MEAELHDGTILEFPDGTDPQVIQATVKKMMVAQPEKQTWGNLPANATNKMLSGMADSVLNTPNNLLNLGKAAVGTVATAAGHPEYAPETTPNPDYITNSAKKYGFINEREMTSSQKVADKLIQSGGAMLLSPANSVKQAIANVGTGVAASAAGDVAGKVTGSPLAEIAANIAVPAAIGKVARVITDKNALRTSVDRDKNAILAEGKDAGYVVPPSHINKTFVKNRMEAIAGKSAIAQEANQRNQKVTNALAAKELGLPADQPITVQSLEGLRSKYGKVYEEVSNLPVTARADNPYTFGAKKSIKSDVEDWKQANNDANAWYKTYARSASPDDLAKAKSFSREAKRLHSSIIDTAKRAGREDLVDKLATARKEIAKTYTVENSLNPAFGEIDAAYFGKQLDQGKPLSGNFELIGKYNKTFPLYTKTGAKTQTPGVSKSEMIASVLFGLGGTAAMGPFGTSLAALPFIAPPTRAMLLSKPFQKLSTESKMEKIAEILSKAKTEDVQKLAGIVSAQRMAQGE